jgi:hypothetical protein
MFPFLSVFIANIVFYSILKKKCKLETNIFLYGIGFTLSIVPVLFIYIILLEIHSHTPAYFNYYYMLSIHALSLTSLFYLYTTLPKDEKNINMATLCLTSITVAFLLIGVATDELFKLHFISILPIFLGLYAGYYTIYRTVRLSPRLLAWAPTLTLTIYCI